MNKSTAPVTILKIVKVLPANTETRFAERIYTGTNGFLLRRKSSVYQQVISAAKVPRAASKNKKPEDIELEKAHKKAIPSIAGIECLLKRDVTASFLRHTFEIKNSHNKVRHVAVATG